MGAVEAHRPGVAVAVAGAGLVGNPPCGRVGGRRQAREDVGGEPGGLGRDQALALRGVVGAKRGEGDGCAEPGEGGVALHEVGQCDADAAKRYGEAGLAAGDDRPCPGAAEGSDEAGRANGIGQADDGDVERELQRLTHRDRAAKPAVEVLRRVGAEGGGAILDQRFGMGEAIVEGQRIDEGLERGAGGTERHGHVDEPGAAVVGPVGGADGGEDLS